ncbi:hypothetical protein T09_3541 [Trichinella sp. T9]|nr:hypothetical protein T09_3541 [Trichinella sp. T9]
MIFLQKQGPYCHYNSVQDTAQENQPSECSRFSVKPTVPTFQVVVGSDIYIMYIPKRQSFIGHPLLPKILK